MFTNVGTVHIACAVGVAVGVPGPGVFVGVSVGPPGVLVGPPGVLVGATVGSVTTVEEQPVVRSREAVALTFTCGISRCVSGSSS